MSRWVGWITEAKVARTEEWVERNQMMTTAMDIILSDEAKYGTKLHAITDPNVGGHKDQGRGEEGRAACGVQVPEDVPGVTVRSWYGVEVGASKCRRCVKVVQNREETNENQM